MTTTAEMAFVTERAYLHYLDNLIRERFGNRAALCRKLEISESAASHLFANRARAGRIERKILNALGLKKQRRFIVTPI